MKLGTTTPVQAGDAKGLDPGTGSGSCWLSKPAAGGGD